MSSVLNKDTRSYGKQFLTDGKEETCWNSDQVLKIVFSHIRLNRFCVIEGENQWILLNFSQLVQVKKIEIRFQGGFSSSQFDLEMINNTEETKKIVQFYPQDNNSNQVKILYRIFSGM